MSVALHAAAILLVIWALGHPKIKASRSTPMRLSLRTLPASPQAVKRPPSLAVTSRPRGQVSAPPVTTPAPTAPKRAPAIAAKDAPTLDPPAGAPGNVLTAPDSDRTARLFPKIPGTHSFGTVSGDLDHRGHTVHNDPSELPDPTAVAAYNAERARGTVNGWINDELAFQRVQNGIVDTYFSDLRKSLAKYSAHPPKFSTQDVANELTGSWLAAAAQYGKTGNPNAAGHESENGSWMQQFADGQFGGGLVAIVEIRQGSNGALEGAALLKSSGDPRFDQHVMRSAPLAIEHLDAPPSGGGPGLHAAGMRTTWAFQGRVVYTKKLKDVDIKKDLLKMIATAPLTLASTRFEETTGDVYVVDVASPEYTCDVKLLKVY